MRYPYKQISKAALRQQKGVASVLFVLILPAVMLFYALASDGVRMLHVKSKMQESLDNSLLVVASAAHEHGQPINGYTSDTELMIRASLPQPFSMKGLTLSESDSKYLATIRADFDWWFPRLTGMGSAVASFEVNSEVNKPSVSELHTIFSVNATQHTNRRENYLPGYSRGLSMAMADGAAYFITQLIDRGVGNESMFELVPYDSFGREELPGYAVPYNSCATDYRRNVYYDVRWEHEWPYNPKYEHKNGLDAWEWNSDQVKRNTVIQETIDRLFEPLELGMCAPYHLIYKNKWSASPWSWYYDYLPISNTNSDRGLKYFAESRLLDEGARAWSIWGGAYDLFQNDSMYNLAEHSLYGLIHASRRLDEIVKTNTDVNSDRKLLIMTTGLADIGGMVWMGGAPGGINNLNAVFEFSKRGVCQKIRDRFENFEMHVIMFKRQHDFMNSAVNAADRLLYAQGLDICFNGGSSSSFNHDTESYTGTYPNSNGKLHVVNSYGQYISILNNILDQNATSQGGNGKLTLE